MLLQPSRTKRIKPPSRLKPLLFRVIGVVAVILLIGVGTRSCVDAVASQSIENRTVGVGNVNVASGDVPAVFYYGILGGLRNGSISMHDIVATPINIAKLEVSAHDLRFSRTKLITGKADLTGSAPYRTTIYLSPKNLSDYLTTTVTFQTNYLVATIDGHNMHVVPKLKGRSIVIADERNTYEIPLPGPEYLPCKPTGFGIGNGIVVSCESDKLPRIVADAT